MLGMDDHGKKALASGPRHDEIRRLTCGHRRKRLFIKLITLKFD
jgi:hypothetical protein